jgi:phenylalanyl-tRNA synthetase beta subunit
MDFFDLKGIVEGMLAGLHVDDVITGCCTPSLHPGKTAEF